MLRVLTLVCLCIAPLASRADEPFDVSLASSTADLAPYYHAIIRQATDRFRGDPPSQNVVGRSHTTSAAGFEVEEITDYRSGVTHFYLRQTSAVGARMIIAEAHFESDPFPAELASIYNGHRSLLRP